MKPPAPRVVRDIYGPSVKPHAAYYHINEKRFVCRVWTNDQWLRLSSYERPLNAQQIGDLGWVVLEPTPGDPLIRIYRD